MNDIFRFQVSGFSYPGLTGRATDPVFRRHFFACVKQFRAGRPVNRTVHTAASQHPGVGGINDGIDFSRGDIPLDNFYGIHIFYLWCPFFFMVSTF
jgi:hypothetical protein